MDQHDSNTNLALRIGERRCKSGTSVFTSMKRFRRDAGQLLSILPCLNETPAVLVTGIPRGEFRFHVDRSKSSEIEDRFSWEPVDHASIFFSLRASQSFVFFTSPFWSRGAVGFTVG
jgi:hypothetical protein